jgi:thiamine kinase-like enzyme
VKGMVDTGVVMGSRLYYEKMSKFLDNLGESSSKNQSDIEQWDKYLGEYKQFMDQMKEKVIIMRK